ncbi:frataxin homolog, mitochondrial [Diutina catenulata]
MIRGASTRAIHATRASFAGHTGLASLAGCSMPARVSTTGLVAARRLSSRGGAMSRGASASSVVRGASAVRGATTTVSTTMSTRAYSIKTTSGEEIDESSIDQLSENEYDRHATVYLETLADELEVLSEDHPDIEADLNHGVLELELPPNGSYFINKQPPNKQIWLSSPLTGPKRYDMINGKWTTLRDGTTLTELMEDEIGKALGREFKFESLEE